MPKMRPLLLLLASGAAATVRPAIANPPLLRRALLARVLTVSPLVVSAPLPVAAVVQQLEGFTPRVEGIGGGADLLSSKPAVADVTFPPSMIGPWQCQRSLLSVEGDAGQAEGAWRALGGTGNNFAKGSVETYAARFLPSPSGVLTDGGVGVVADRGFEMRSRAGAATNATWDASLPDRLVCVRSTGLNAGGATELVVVERRVELPSDRGFGSNELVRVTSAAGGLFGDSQLMRACRVQRRFRRAYNEAGERVVEGLEIVKTYRVLDGIAGVELPTSTTKSKLTLTRPTGPVNSNF